MKAQVKREIRTLRKELEACNCSMKIIDIKSMIKVLETMLEDLN
jgi:hypothetical protein